MTKNVDTRRPFKIGLRAYNNLPQPSKARCKKGVVEGPCVNSFVTHFYINFV